MGGTRRQLMMVYVQIMDQVNQEKKYSMTGQRACLILWGKRRKRISTFPCPTWASMIRKRCLLLKKKCWAFMVSGHPLEKYEERWRKSITAVTADFQWDDEVHAAKVHDGARAVIGGMASREKTIKYTKNNQVMAFLTIEDLVGTVEVIVFPRDYEKNSPAAHGGCQDFCGGTGVRRGGEGQQAHLQRKSRCPLTRPKRSFGQVPGSAPIRKRQLN